jgi:RNA polymerase sigma factor (sigma-70 family)
MYSEAHEFLDDDFETINNLREIVINAIDELSQQDRFIIEAIAYEQITYEELSKRLGVSSVHAWRLYKTAQENLKNILLQNQSVLDYLNG